MAIVHRLLSPLVQVREEESITLLLMTLYAFLAMLAYNILKPLAAGMFIGVHGAENLPLMILAAGPLITVIMLTITAVSARLPRRWVIQITQALTVVLLVAFSVILRVGAGFWSAIGVYLLRLILGVLLASQVYMLATDVYDPRQAKRFFGLITAGMSLGGLTASIVVNQSVEVFGFDNLMLVGAGLIVGCMAIVTAVRRRVKDVAPKTAAAPSEEKVAWNEGFRMLRDSKHLRTIAIVIALAAMGASLIDQQLSMAAEESAGAGEGEGISALLAQVQGYTSLFGLIISVWLTARIHRYLGVGVALLLLPISLGGTAVAMLLTGVVTSAMVARIVDTSLRYSVDKTAISEFPKWRKYLILLSFLDNSSARPVQIGGVDVNICHSRSAAVRGRRRSSSQSPPRGPFCRTRTGPVEADGAVDAQNAPTAPWKTLCVFHELPQGLSHQVTHEKGP